MNIYLKPVEACNLACKHCYNGTPNSDRLAINEATVRFLASLVSESKDDENWLILHGGEPLMASPEQLRAVTAINIPGVKKRITTNLAMELSAPRKETLLSMDDIRTSFDVGLGRFSTLRHFLTWVRNVLWCRENNLNLSTLNVCLSAKLVATDPTKLLKMALQLGFKKISFENLCLTGRLAKHQGALVPSPREVDQWLLKLYNSLTAFKNIEIANFISLKAGICGDWKNYRGKACCDQAFTINADGTIGSCPNSARTSILGDISMSGAEIVSRKCSSCSTRLSHIQECLACSYFKQCRGGCREQDWIDGVCPYPKATADAIRKDLTNESVPILSM